MISAYRVWPKILQIQKFHNEKVMIEKKIVCVSKIRGHWIFFSMQKKKVSKIYRKRALTRNKETLYANKASNKTSGWKWIYYSMSTVCFLYLIKKWWLNFSMRILNLQLIHCENFTLKTDERILKAVFHWMEWNGVLKLVRRFAETVNLIESPRNDRLSLSIELVHAVQSVVAA